MRRKLPHCNFWVVITVSTTVSMAGCAASPDIDGGIVGTGNRFDCTALAKKQGVERSLPEECRADAATSRRHLAR
jgi:hypothetical protein